MKRIPFLLLLLSVGISSCSKQEIVEEDITSTESNSITIQEALSNLDDFLDVIKNEKGPGTRVISERQINNIIAVSSSSLKNYNLTRSIEANDPTVYLVNYKDERGFAILSANKKLPDPVIAVTEKGNINPDFSLDNCENDEFSAFINDLLMGYFDTSCEDTKATRSSSTTLYNIAPEFPNWWDQDGIFERYCFDDDSAICPVGCVPLALAMSLCHYKRTSHWLYVYGNDYDCTTMQDFLLNTYSTYNYRSTLIDSVARYVHAMAKAVHTNFAPSGSSATLEEAAIYLHSIDIYNAYRHLDFDLDYVIDMLPYQKPVVMSGFANALFAHGHAWIVDGIHQELQSNGDIKTMLHCNWGRGGTANGYYASRTFSPHAGPEYTGSGDPTNLATLARNYNYYHRTLTY